MVGWVGGWVRGWVWHSQREWPVASAKHFPRLAYRSRDIVLDDTCFFFISSVSIPASVAGTNFLAFPMGGKCLLSFLGVHTGRPAALLPLSLMLILHHPQDTVKQALSGTVIPVCTPSHWAHSPHGHTLCWATILPV